MLHPVGWPNHGPKIEHYLAEEAVGLVKSLGWSLSRGPMWETVHENENLSEDEDLDAEVNEEQEAKMRELKEIEEFGIVLDRTGAPVYDKK